MNPFHVSAAAMFCSAILLLILLSGTTTSAQNTTTPTLSCDPAACGGLRIAYPFWLGGTHPPECGYGAFQVMCDRDGTASLKNSIWRYQILEISYEDSTFRVANWDISDGTCDIEVHLNISSDLGLAPFSISPTNQELFFLYNCTDLHPPPSWAPMNCTNWTNVSTVNSFALLAGGYKPDNKWAPVPGNCRVSMMPVLGYPGAAGKDYWELMKAGFVLDYTAGDCAACKESDGRCRIDTDYDIFQCHCSYGVSSLVVCGNCTSLMMSVLGYERAADVVRFVFECMASGCKVGMENFARPLSFDRKKGYTTSVL